MLFPNCYNKQGIQSNLPSYTPMNQGPICAKVYPEGIQPIKGNNCGLIPYSTGHSVTKRFYKNSTLKTLMSFYKQRMVRFHHDNASSHKREDVKAVWVS